MNEDGIQRFKKGVSWEILCTLGFPLRTKYNVKRVNEMWESNSVGPARPG